jgi:hypothetical protein
MRLLISGIVIFIIVASCYYDSEEFLYPQINDTCDTTNITFSVSVKTILDNYCASCHNNSVADLNGSSVRLEDYTDVKAYTDNGKLLNAIKQTGIYPMPLPLGSPKLDDCKIATFDIWKKNNYPQ